VDPTENRQFVFLFGVHRSGTTWVGKIFDSHPQILYRHEPDTFSDLPAMPFVADVAQTDAYRGVVTEFLDSLPGANSRFVAGSLPVFRKAYRSRWQNSAHLLSVFSATFGRQLSRGFPVFAYADYRSAPDLQVVWKSICSLGRLGVLMRVASHRKAIILLRHPCGVIASVKRGRAGGILRNDASVDYPLLGAILESTSGKRYGVTVEDLRRMQPEERLAWKWILTYEKALDDIEGLNDVAIVVRYEDVCVDPEGWTRKMFAFCGLSWNPQTEHFIVQSTGRSGRRARSRLMRSGYFSVFKDPLQSASKWREELEPIEIERILGVLSLSSLARFYPS
jgi:hypothetical protein